MRGQGESLSGVNDALIGVGEFAIELRFIAIVQDLSHVRSRQHAQLQQMAARDERGGSLGFNVQSTRTFQQPGAGRKSVKGFGRAASQRDRPSRHAPAGRFASPA